MRVTPIKKVGAGLMVAGALTIFAGFLGVGSAGAVTNWDPADNASLKTSQQGSTNPAGPGQETGSCPAPPPGAAGDWGWHFVLPGNSTTFVTIDVDFQNDGFTQHAPFVADPSAKHAYVYTSGPDTLLDAKAVVNGTETEFVLSHVCTGTTSSSSSSSSSSVSDTSSSTSSSSSSSSSTSSSSSVSDTSSSTSSSSSSESSSSTSSSSSEVLGTSDSRSSSSQSAAPTTPASVLGSEIARTQALPRTGVDPSSLLLLGLGLAMSGTALLASANRFSRSRS